MPLFGILSARNVIFTIEHIVISKPKLRKFKPMMFMATAYWKFQVGCLLSKTQNLHVRIYLRNTSVQSSGVAQSVSRPKVPATHPVSVSQGSCSVSASVTVNIGPPIPLTQPPSCIIAAGPQAVVITIVLGKLATTAVVITIVLGKLATTAVVITIVLGKLATT